MEVKDRIFRLRTEKGMTHTELASYLKKSEGAVRMWETGRSKPDIDTILKLADFFECSTDYLLGKEDFKTDEEEKIFSAGIISAEHIFSGLCPETANAISRLLTSLKTALSLSPSANKNPINI